MRRPTHEEQHGHEGPDYLNLVIEWDSIADELDRGMTTASSQDMPNKDPDWLVEEAGRESFPASDPPAWGSSRRETIGIEDIGVDVDATRTKRRRRTPIVLGVLGVVALAGIFVGIRYLRHR